MGCLGNSKTEDQRNEEKAQREANKKIEKQLQKDKQIYRATHRLLLLGGFCVLYRLCFSVRQPCFLVKKKAFQYFTSGDSEISTNDAIAGWCHSTVSGHSPVSCILALSRSRANVRRLAGGYCAKAADGGSQDLWIGLYVCLSLPFPSLKTNTVHCIGC